MTPAERRELTRGLRETAMRMRLMAGDDLAMAETLAKLTVRAAGESAVLGVVRVAGNRCTTSAMYNELEAGLLEQAAAELESGSHAPD